MTNCLQVVSKIVFEGDIQEILREIVPWYPWKFWEELTLSHYMAFWCLNKIIFSKIMNLHQKWSKEAKWFPEWRISPLQQADIKKLLCNADHHCHIFACCNWCINVNKIVNVQKVGISNLFRCLCIKVTRLSIWIRGLGNMMQL